jgi:hypothetical protein
MSDERDIYDELSEEEIAKIIERRIVADRRYRDDDIEFENRRKNKNRRLRNDVEEDRRSGEERRKLDFPFDHVERRTSSDRRHSEDTTETDNEESGFEVEFAGMKFKGGMIAVLFTALSTLGGAGWAGFEFYKDYMDMREIVQNIDTTEIENRNQQIEIKMEEMLVQVNQAIDYSRSIKNDLRDDFNRMEKNVDRVEDEARKMEDKVKSMVDRANERFDIKRESLQNDSRLQMEALEARINKKIQQALDNPLSDN